MKVEIEAPRYLRDPMGAVVSLGAVRDQALNGDWRLRVELHRLGWVGSPLEARSAQNRIAHLYATIGNADASRAICFCQIGIREGTPVEATADFLVREFLDRAQEWVGSREILGEAAVAVSTQIESIDTSHFSFRLRVDADRRRHYSVPRVSPVTESPFAHEAYVEVQLPDGVVLGLKVRQENCGEGCGKAESN